MFPSWRNNKAFSKKQNWLAIALPVFLIVAVIGVAIVYGKSTAALLRNPLAQVNGCASNADCSGTTTTPICDQSAHICVGCTGNYQCSGGDSCNTAQCENDGSCSLTQKPDQTRCDDGNACTEVDICIRGLCLGTTPVLCPAPDGCHSDGECIPATGACAYQIEPDGTDCDEDLCTKGTCNNGACRNLTSILLCPAPSDECHITGTCNPLNGMCSDPPAPDGTDCTVTIPNTGTTGPGKCLQGRCYAQPSDSGPTGPPSPPPDSCFYCYYQDFPECHSEDGDNGPLDCEQIYPQQDNSHCVWIDDTAKCQSRFYPICKRQYDGSTAVSKNMTAVSDADELANRIPRACPILQSFYEGHSHGPSCNALSDQIRLCITGAANLVGPVYLQLDNNGCSTFANQDQVYDRIHSIQAAVQAANQTRPANAQISIRTSGNQAVANLTTCVTPWTIDITSDQIQESFGDCIPGNYCYDSGETARCTTVDGQITRQTCCQTNSSATNKAWVLGETCPPPPPPPCAFGSTCVGDAQSTCTDWNNDNNITQSICCHGLLRPGSVCPDATNGVESGTAVANSCEDAQDGAWSIVLQQLLVTRDACEPPNTFQHNCSAPASEPSQGICSATVTCPWTCE